MPNSGPPIGVSSGSIVVFGIKVDNTKPNEAFIVEDAGHGIEAAKSSGAKVMAVRGYEDVNLSLFLDLNLV